jgi:hypothetical protein
MFFFKPADDANLHYGWVKMGLQFGDSGTFSAAKHNAARAA